MAFPPRCLRAAALLLQRLKILKVCRLLKQRPAPDLENTLEHALVGNALYDGGDEQSAGSSDDACETD